ncbi:MAG: hypothetical protein IPH65_17305 [Dehalococcoidia bacterium]|uniref:hypothetical protein n=1 Tax=Candidatus Amarobacter glycogenicus TaxID=3140699 RepID=UPI0031360135|nr:hypothetical protein [Dehalococcoidia bacterium]
MDDIPAHFSGRYATASPTGEGSLANNPGVLLLDELTTGLDVSVGRRPQSGPANSRNSFTSPWSWSLTTSASSSTACGRTMVMKDGRVVESGLTDQVLSKTRTTPYTQLLVASMT